MNGISLGRDIPSELLDQVFQRHHQTLFFTFSMANQRPGKLHADKAYSSRKNRRGLLRRGITARIAWPGIESKQRLGRHRWVVERTNAWINQQRRLRVRDERRDDVHFALLVLGCCLILFRGLQT